MAVISATPTKTEQSSALTRLSPGRALKLVPFIALGFDAVMVTLVSLLAATLHPIVPIFDAAEDLGSTLTLAGPLMGLGWLVGIAIIGGYDANVFGSGADEFKRVFR